MRKLSKIVAFVAIFAVGAFGFVATSPTTNAATDICTWTGTTSANWSVGTNWSCSVDGAVIPENGDSLVFPAGAANLTNVNDIGALSFTTLSFAGNYAISGSALTVTGGAITATAGSTTMSAPLVLGASTDVTTSGTGALSLASAINLSSNTLTLTAGGNGINLPGVVSGTGSIIKAGAGVTNVSGNNTYSGATTVNAGALNLSHSNALGSAAGATTVAAGATVNILVGGLNIPESITISGTGNVSGGALRNFAGANTWSGDIAIGANATYMNSDSGNFLTVTGHLTGATTGLQLSGRFLFTNSNTYSGTIATSGLTTKIYFNGTNAFSTLTANTNAIITGAGSIGALATAGTVEVIAGSDAPGTLSTGNLTLNATTTVPIELRSLGNDLIAVTGTVNLANAILTTDLNYAAADGTQYIIVSNNAADAVTGTFAGLPEGTTFVTGGTNPMNVRISYVGGTGNDVVLTVINPAVVVPPVVTPVTAPNTGVKSESLAIFIIAGITGFALIVAAIVFTRRYAKSRS